MDTYVNLVGRIDVTNATIGLLDILALGAVDADSFYLYITSQGDYAYAFTAKNKHLCPASGKECDFEWKEGVPRCLCMPEEGETAWECHRTSFPLMSNAGPVFVIEDHEGNAARIEKLQRLVIEQSSPIRKYGRHQVPELNPDYHGD